MQTLFQLLRFALFAFVLFAAKTSFAQLNVPSSKSLLQRIVPAQASQFIIEPLSAINGKDVFEIESRGKKIVLRGNNGVAIASALYHYLDEYCHCQITWNGVNLALPKTLPLPAKKIRQQTPYNYRYYLNYCTFNYSMSWWDWPRWEKEIDWMALHGINLPLAITGEEYTWYLVYKDMGFTDDELKNFFCGPSYFAWFWMGNLDGWGGPLPLSWMTSHFALQKKILARERELGMKPVLPAFTGHVPVAFQKKFPAAKLKTTNWKSGFGDTYILDANDPLFASIGKKFLEKQTVMLGTDHFYSADTFNENEPPSDEPSFLTKLSASVYEGMRKSDTAAVWVMQGWLFFSDRKFWKEPQTEALLKAVPNDKMIILDLATEIEPVWKRTAAFYGKPWIWNMLNNFGGNNNLFGRMETAATEPAKALHDAGSGKLQGIGLTMEAIEQNPVLYELMTANTWRNEVIDLNIWLPQYLRNRYGINNNDALTAWEILNRTVYTVPADKYIRDGAESILQSRPTFDSFTRWTKTKLNYNAKDLLPAWDALLKASASCTNSDGYQYDLVDLTRQVLANYALPLHQKFVAAYADNNLAAFENYSQQFIDLIEDMDELLATRKEFLLGPWVAAARSWGRTVKEKALYEMNAKDLITLWGNKDCPLNEYSCRQWSGLLNDFYKPRWQQFFAKAKEALRNKKNLDTNAFIHSIKEWEWSWVNERKDYAQQTHGDAIIVAKKMYAKYRKLMDADVF
ncbi:alpha-N-acetylglucosaminidase [Flavisolibacter ginsenosidimutans]|uniref:Alpha-N-acetylglucosaminidase n=1 Tax=Flavisolibacter ginsenosidimutans TaxID=661481 RepID=A0A5B8UGL1_9BACT|nr:alpha-N-acetylglucosaminidase [Flavisolibacter ginsenosidimutans]QEC55643.1 alpha-N-acetylglucosaminidase [Flavisolibacter ginsenosidimutans]